MPSRLATKGEIDLLLVDNKTKYPEDYEILKSPDRDIVFLKTTIGISDAIKQSLFTFSFNPFYHKFSFGTSVLPYTLEEMIDVIAYLKIRSDQLFGAKPIAGIHSARCAFFRDHEKSGPIHAEVLAEAINAVEGPGSAVFYPTGKRMQMDILDGRDIIRGEVDLGLVYAHTIILPNKEVF